MSEGHIPILFSANCFSSPLGSIVGQYNPRIDGIFLSLDAVEESLRPFVLDHEGRGHRAPTTDGTATAIRVQRYIAGTLYSYIAQLWLFLSETGLSLQGRSLEDLQLVGRVPSGTDYYLRFWLGTPESVFQFLLGNIKKLHEAITLMNNEIRPTYEIIALAPTIDELRRRLPREQAKRYEELLVNMEARELEREGLVDTKRFRSIYRSFLRLEPHTRLRLSRHALDVGYWGVSRGVIPLTAHIEQSLTRFSNLIANVRRTARRAGRRKTRREARRRYILRQRIKDKNAFEIWLNFLYRFGPMRYVSEEARFPWHLMALLDYVLFEPKVRRAHVCTGDLSGCMEDLNESLLMQLISGEEDHISTNARLMRAALTLDADGRSHMAQFISAGDDNKLSPNPLNLAVDWYKWVLLFETFYIGLASGQGIGCPLAYAKQAGCSEDCTLRRHLRALSKRSQLVTEPICPLVET